MFWIIMGILGLFIFAFIMCACILARKCDENMEEFYEDI